ncbi:MAG TPA: nitroreductase family protein [Acidimicrobiia bacterium]|nr:nitroreductase family protein [Acidimicrobiia bacterium]
MSSELDRRTVDHLLSTTRSVRKRLDLDRPVPPDVIEECLRLAIQAPTGSNRQGWHFVVVTDADKRAALADMYRDGAGDYLDRARAGSGSLSRTGDSALWLTERLERVPVHVIPCIGDYTKGRAHAGVWASVYPAVWSLQLALRSRGLGSVLTTFHLARAGDAAALLGIPDGVLQAGLVPVAFYTGDDFKPAKRHPVEQVTSWNEWGKRR